MSIEYRPRVVDEYYLDRLQSIGALLIKGPKWCGKTTTAERLSSSAIFLQDPDYRDYYNELGNRKPSALLQGDHPRLIDEWQDIPKIWDAVRFDVDRNGSCGRYILTGSCTPKKVDENEENKHTGTGRIASVTMHTMSLYESGESTGEVSLSSLFNGNIDYDAQSLLSIDDISYLLCRGGWPGVLDLEEKYALKAPRDYYESVINSDISKVDDVKRNPYVADAILKSYARNICVPAELTTILRDVGSVATRPTVSDYIGALRRIFVIEDIPSWRPSLMSKARVRAAPKRCFSDPSIAVATMGAGPGALLSDMQAFGSLFESLCVRDIRVYADLIGGKVMHYHDTTDLEVDIIIELPDGRWCAIEVKLGMGEDEGAKNLLKLKKKTVLSSGIDPSFLAVITGSGFFHVRPDGVMVIPIGCLGP